ncbi:radical SAM family heme chaperone HemW [Bacillus sp. FJAT-45350]|uniref:radical SAM family heme chaperone HemW n=1 Tax=Bacillus sp. FJAT-45350 TaxID=2011014 RepID=UPI000BB887BD|nr:radical SAM family heme chaperone HemW [Bacillus sp. FJAT-45350]
MPKAIYLHIPFCEHICHYCDFNKVFLHGQPVEEYLFALKEEMKNSITEQGEVIKTIYIGGGTPTALSLKQLEFLFESIEQYFPNKSDDLEYTVEVNPGSVDVDKLAVLAKAGVNRLSIGVQSFDEGLLRQIGRTHLEVDVAKTIELSRAAGFKNISLDLMFGLPTQTIEQFQTTLKKAFELNVEHFSAYSLKVEAKTVFYNLQRKGKLPLPTEEEEANMYSLLIEEMQKNGYEQYEISNFAKKGYESKHNLTYWDNEEYYGFGAGAHGYVNGVRHANAGPLPKYFSLIEKSGLPHQKEHHVPKNEQMEEFMFMGLRKIRGVSTQIFKEKFGSPIDVIYGEQISYLIKQGWLKGDNDYIKLTREGLFFGNEVFEKFLVVE